LSHQTGLKHFLLLLSFFLFTLNHATSNATMQFSHNHFHYGANLTPHPEKVYKGGEDAYFANNYVLAVADGVGGNALSGIDPSEYSKTLCRLIGGFVNEGKPEFTNNPKKLIHEAAMNNPHRGTSTLAVAYLDRDAPILRTSYIGDTRYAIYRKIEGKWAIFYEAQEQQRRFNFPYQLGRQADHPSVAWEFQHEVQDGDIVVLASDGLFDNMYAQEVLEHLSKYINEEGEIKDPQTAVDELVKKAYDLSLDPNYDSPFQRRAKELRIIFQGGYPGGKSDDITVIVAQVKLFKKGDDQILQDMGEGEEKPTMTVFGGDDL